MIGEKQLLTFVVSVKELIQDQLPKQGESLEEIYGVVPETIIEESKNLLLLVS